MADWTFLTNHALVLLRIANDPDVRLRDIAAAVGITERAALRIVTDLEKAGYVSRTRVGRRSHYTVHPDQPFRHPTQRHMQIGSLLRLLTGRSDLPAEQAS